ncbi:MAG: sensor histidine kinase [Chromatiaceae bacterium]|nr:sensor histidine kinase [Chromatiaceae bacterium]
MSPAPSSLLPRLLSRLAMLMLAVVTVAALALWNYYDGLTRLASEGRHEIDLHVAHLRGLLAKYEPLPELLATNPRLIDFLRAPGGQESIEGLNRYLATINRISDAADTYLMDAEGLTIAASNWQAERPFIGRNFSFRPYFRDAMAGQLGRYFALGTTSRQRGYYFAYPVRDGDDILGAVVVKLDINETEHRWAQPGRIVLVTDPDGVIFISTRPEQRFRTLQPLDPASRARILASNRYPEAALAPLGIREHLHLKAADEDREGALFAPRLVQLDGDNAWHAAIPYLLQSRFMPDAGWQVHLLTDSRALIRESLRLSLLAGALIASASLALVLLRQRQEGRRAHAALAEEARAALERINLELERGVAARTAELTRANQRLRDEIEERRRTEQALRETQQALVQSAKLATLGQMSAGINHELNQPLAAIRTYADNGRLLLAKGRTEEVAANLAQILALTERMAKIGSQLKLFARKTSGEVSALPLAAALESAARLVAPALRQADARLEVEIPPGLEVRANDVLLQQVLVNLLGNACQAVEGRARRLIQIRAWKAEDQVVTQVCDSGPGIPDDNRQLIFEPFFTTKAPGDGLGLGLTISARISADMGGSLGVLPGSEGDGACFELRLPAA